MKHHNIFIWLLYRPNVLKDLNPYNEACLIIEVYPLIVGSLEAILLYILESLKKLLSFVFPLKSTLWDFLCPFKGAPTDLPGEKIEKPKQNFDRMYFMQLIDHILP